MEAICTDPTHGGGARSTKPGELPNLWRCTHFDCGGIQAWRAHEQENERDQLAEVHRWERHYGLPLTPLPSEAGFKVRTRGACLRRRGRRHARRNPPA